MNNHQNNILRARRRELELTQAQVADKVGVSEATVSRWETGDIAEVGSGKLAALARALHLSPAQLLGQAEEESELSSYLEQLRTRPEMRAFFSLAKNATKREVQDAMRIVEAYFAGRSAPGEDEDAEPGMCRAPCPRKTNEQEEQRVNEVLITYLALPMGVNGLVSPTPEGDYQVILNARHSPQMQRETYRHELRHILLNHFSQDAEALAPLEAAASLTRLPGESAGHVWAPPAGAANAAPPADEQAQTEKLESAIRHAEDFGLSCVDFSQNSHAKQAGGLPCAIDDGLLRAARNGGEAEPVRAIHEAPMAAVAPAAELAQSSHLLRALRAQLTGLHY